MSNYLTVIHPDSPRTADALERFNLQKQQKKNDQNLMRPSPGQNPSRNAAKDSEGKLSARRRVKNTHDIKKSFASLKISVGRKTTNSNVKTRSQTKVTPGKTTPKRAP
jgi:hypothetical protein